MKQTWLLSCLGSLGKRKKTVEGKLNAMFSKEIRGRRREAGEKVAAAVAGAVVAGGRAVAGAEVAGGRAVAETTPLLAVTAAKKRRRSPSVESASLETLECVETWDSERESAASAEAEEAEGDFEGERRSRIQGISKRGRKRRKRANSRAKAVARAAAQAAAQATAQAAARAGAQPAVRPIKGSAIGKRR